LITNENNLNKYSLADTLISIFINYEMHQNKMAAT